MVTIIHLHCHTHKDSLLDSTVRTEELAKRVKELDMSAVAVTGHGYMTSVIDHYKDCKEQGIKPIIGCEVYQCEDMSVRDPKSKYDHLVLLAKNEIGYSNLLQLVSLGFTDGFYYKPRVDIKTIMKYREGLIAMSACLGGEIPRMIMRGATDNDLLAKTTMYNCLFENYYLELQSHNNKEQKLVNKKLVWLSKETGIPLVVTSDVHFLREEDFKYHGKFIEINQDRDNEIYQDCWLKTEKEIMDVIVPQVGFDASMEAIANTHTIADMCNVVVELGNSYLPDFPIPKQFKNEDEYLKHLVNKGFVDRGIDKLNDDELMVYINRAKYEYDIITYKGYSGYFLIVWDFLNECRKENIYVGDGRGSAGGSLVCYLLGITNIDPIEYELDFGRFLTLERVALPDIDTDIQSSRRHDAIDILRDRYGNSQVAQICTFFTIGAKAGFDDVGRILNISYDTIEKIKKQIPDLQDLATALDSSDKLKQYKNKYPELFDIVEHLEGLVKTISVHAGGVVVAPQNKTLNDFTALTLSKDGDIITQLEMHNVEEVGLVKIDALGITVLDIIADSLDMVFGG